MIDIKMSQTNLIDKIRRLARECVDCKQVYRRLEDLLELKLESIKDELSSRMPDHLQSEILRLSLQHEDYLKILEKYLASKSLYIHSKVMYDTHLMLFEARRSLNSYNREALINKKENPN